MTAPRIRSIQPALEGRRSDIERGKAVHAKNYEIDGRIEFTGVGEATFDARFPVWFFIDSPQMSFGAELTGNQALNEGTFPTVNVMVQYWTTTIRNNITYYTGARFIIVIEGDDDITGLAHWTLRGTGLTNPLTPP